MCERVTVDGVTTCPSCGKVLVTPEQAKELLKKLNEKDKDKVDYHNNK